MVATAALLAERRSHGPHVERLAVPLRVRRAVAAGDSKRPRSRAADGPAMPRSGSSAYGASVPDASRSRARRRPEMDDEREMEQSPHRDALTGKMDTGREDPGADAGTGAG